MFSIDYFSGVKALCEMSKSVKIFKIMQKYFLPRNSPIVNNLIDFHLYYCIEGQKSKNNVTGRNRWESGLQKEKVDS